MALGGIILIFILLKSLRLFNTAVVMPIGNCKTVMVSVTVIDALAT